MYDIRNARMEDLPVIQDIYAYARGFMAKTGNPNQWGQHHPPYPQLVQDVKNGRLYVMEDASGIHGVFFFWIGEDPTYRKITQGCWGREVPYGTIHRIAGDGSGGILASAVFFASQKISYIRIDTHQDNQVMQKALAKQGFQKRGIIFLEDGSPRIAYDKSIDNKK